MKSVRRKVWDQVETRIGCQIMDSLVDRHVEAQIWDSGSQIWDRVWVEIMRQVVEDLKV